MVKLNKAQRKALAVAIPYNHRKDFRAAIRNEAPDLKGLTESEFFECISELEDMGLARGVANKAGNDAKLVLSSDAVCYFRASKVEVAKTLGRYAFQLLLGASGGLVVFLLGRVVA